MRERYIPTLPPPPLGATITDLSVFTEADLDAFAYKLNNRLRQTLDWMKPSAVLALAVAPTN